MVIQHYFSVQWFKQTKKKRKKIIIIKRCPKQRKIHCFFSPLFKRKKLCMNETITFFVIRWKSYLSSFAFSLTGVTNNLSCINVAAVARRVAVQKQYNTVLPGHHRVLSGIRVARFGNPENSTLLIDSKSGNQFVT